MLKLVDKRNAQEAKHGSDVVHGLTEYADMTEDEFKTKMLTATSSAPVPVAGNLRVASHDGLNHTMHVSTESVTVQALKDWTTGANPRTSPIKASQGACGGCWSWAATEQMESDYYKAFPAGTRYVFSIRQVLQCAGTFPGGCGGGMPHDGYAHVSVNGLINDGKYPLTSSITTNGITGTCAPDWTQTKIKVANVNWAINNEAAMATYVQNTGPIAAVLDFSWGNTYASGIYNGACTTSFNHAVQIVGVETAGATPYWKIRNSYGSGWGESGYFRLQYGVNRCGIASQASYVTGVTVL